MSLPPIVFLFSYFTLGMAASFTPFLEYGPPPAGVLHPSLREAAPLVHQPDLEKHLVKPDDYPEHGNPETDQPKFDFEQPIDHPILNEEQPIFGSLVHPGEQSQHPVNKPCSVHLKSVLPCSQQPQLGSHIPCSEHSDSAKPCSQHLQHGLPQPCSGHPKSAHPCLEQPQPCSGHPDLPHPCSEHPEHGLHQPCSGHPKSAHPCSEQPQHDSQQPCSGHPKSALPCSKHGLQQPCSEQPESEQPILDHLKNEQPIFGQPGSEQLHNVQPVEQPLHVSPDQPIVVVRDGVGQYSVGHEIQGPDGQRVSEQGQLITTNGGWEYVIAKKGSYSYTSPEGILVSVDWEADHNGFRIINSTV